MDFQAIAAMALDRAPELLSTWIGGKRQGHEWVGERRANGGPGDSWSVNLNTGQWLHGAGSEKGGDMVSLYASLNGLAQSEAGKQVAAQVGYTNGLAAAPAPREPVKQADAQPIPPDAPPIPKHPRFGEPSATYRYGNSFVILRYDLAEGKQFAQLTWRNSKWAWKSYPDPKPLFNADQIQQRPEAPVLIVEGEKCAELASATLKAYIVITWAGGSTAAAKSDWSVLKNRKVDIWPDNDEPGRRAAAAISAILLPIAERVRVIDTSGQPTSWDIADFIEETKSHEKPAHHIVEWARERIKTVTREPPKEPAPEPPRVQAPAEQQGLPGYDEFGSDSLFAIWQQLGLTCDNSGRPFATAHNTSMVAINHPRLKNKLWLDEFRGRIYTSVFGDPRPWEDSDTTAFLMFIQGGLQMHKVSLPMAQLAIAHAANLNKRNPLTQWLSKLTWDNIPRLDTWLSDTLGCDRTEYTNAISKNWPIAMVARAFKPGCKVDTMPVLEGKMGRGKSTFLALLAGEFYASLTQAFGSHDFLQAVQGNWLIEVPDMSGFSRRETSMILATITIQTDRYRASYGHLTKDHPRKCLFAATSETDDYLKDPRGRRRYWPIRCQSIDLDALQAQREQVFAEAVQAFRNAQNWWSMPEEEADKEQLARMEEDPWRDRLLAAAEAWASSEGYKNITSSRLLEFAIDMPIRDQTHADKIRVASIMRAANWIQLRDFSNRFWKKITRL